MSENARLVYSTDPGSRCPRCGRTHGTCTCREAGGSAERLPDRIVAKLRIERAGRSGRTVTVVYDLPRNPEFLSGLAAELKRTCGVGGAVRDDSVELQGDQRERVRALLAKKGFVVKG